MYKGFAGSEICIILVCPLVIEHKLLFQPSESPLTTYD
jgi:hypothetical protein